jgi:hypothetical protein
MMFYTGFNYVTQKDYSPIEINKQQIIVQWSPILGVVLIIGGVVLIVRDKIIDKSIKINSKHNLK